MHYYGLAPSSVLFIVYPKGDLCGPPHGKGLICAQNVLGVGHGGMRCSLPSYGGMGHVWVMSGSNVGHNEVGWGGLWYGGSW